MSKNILIISTSLRPNSNSGTLADSFLAGAQAAGNHVEKITLKGKKIAFCTGCLACQKTKKCAINDDAVELADKMCHTDAIVFATPIYYYEMSGQMKTMIDRANALFAADYKFREVYLITTSADGDESIKPVINGLNGWIACFNGVKFCGYVSGGGVDNPADVNNNQELLQKAFSLGKAI